MPSTSPCSSGLQGANYCAMAAQQGKHTIKPLHKNGFRHPPAYDTISPPLFTPCDFPWTERPQTRRVGMPVSLGFLCTEIAQFLGLAIAIAIADPRNRAISETGNAMPHSDFRVRWKIASDCDFKLRFPIRKTISLVIKMITCNFFLFWGINFLKITITITSFNP